MNESPIAPKLAAGQVLAKPAGPVRRVWRRLCTRRRGMAGLAIVGLLGLIALGSPLLASSLPIVCEYKGRWYVPACVETVRQLPFLSSVIGPSRPFGLPTFDARAAAATSSFVIRPPVPFDPREYSADTLQAASRRHWLGTDELGRDVAARLFHGAGLSLRIGVLSMVLAAAIGVLVGTWTGYAGGWTDAIFSRVIEVVTCFPLFFLILSILVWVEAPGVGHVAAVIGLTAWPPIARYVRGEVIRLRDADFAVAARALGATPLRVAFRHLLPNAATPALVATSFGVGQAILMEAGLSWLGFGVPVDAPSWGNMLRSAYDHVLVAPHLVYPPCIAIFLAVVGWNLVGDALRDAMDPKAHGAPA